MPKKASRAVWILGIYGEEAPWNAERLLRSCLPFDTLVPPVILPAGCRERARERTRGGGSSADCIRTKPATAQEAREKQQELGRPRVAPNYPSSRPRSLLILLLGALPFSLFPTAESAFSARRRCDLSWLAPSLREKSSLRAFHSAAKHENPKSLFGCRLTALPVFLFWRKRLID